MERRPSCRLTISRLLIGLNQIPVSAHARRRLRPNLTPDFSADDKWAELRHLPMSLGYVGAWSSLTYRDTIPWADAMIERLDRPPLWICDLSTIKYRPDALKVIRDFLDAEPFEKIHTAADEYLGFLWIRYDRRELSWATFLAEAGQYADGPGCGIECEYFYAMLNELEEADFDSEVETRQREKVRQRLDETISRTRKFYEAFKKRG